jgi:hypothetical protein
MTDNCKWQQGENLEAEIMKADNKRDEKIRKIEQLIDD